MLSKLVALTFDTLEVDTALSTSVPFCAGIVVFVELIGGSEVVTVVLCVW